MEPQARYALLSIVRCTIHVRLKERMRACLPSAAMAGASAHPPPSPSPSPSHRLQCPFPLPLPSSFLFLFFFFFLSPSLSLDPSSDKSSLLLFKSSIHGDPLGVLSSWTEISIPCSNNSSSWSGISCDNATDRVISLDLRRSNLSGTISPSLGNLTMLTYLNLSVNSFTGPIPEELGRLPLLTQLDFKENLLTGPIPPQLGNCTSLQWLDLSHNSLNGTLPPSLGQLSILSMLQLHDIPLLTGPIPPEYGNLTSLQFMYCGGDKGLSGNIPAELGNLVKLQELYLFGNKLNGSIPLQLGSLQSLRILSVFQNPLQGSLPPQLGNLTSLEYMYAFQCGLQGTLPPELGNLRNLKELDLYLNSISGPIPPEFGNLRSLQILNVFSNKLNGTIPKEIGNLTNLQSLYAQSNSLTGQIPSELGQLRSLRFLHLYSNKLNGPLPVEVGNLKNLSELILFSNSLSGNIPTELGNLKALISLYLGDNVFSGSLPSEIGNLENLVYFEVSPNLLTGPIPVSLGKLRNLVYLDLSKNTFSGGLPVELANCTSLQWLKVANNTLSGEIPNDYISIYKIHTMSLAHNNFSGRLPASFSNYSSLVVLDFSRNHFSGTIPDSWAQLVNLRVLSVAYNELQGVLPAWIWNLKQLQLIQLSNNYFTGTIPKEIQNLEGFKRNESDTNQDDTLWTDDVSIDSKGTQLYLKYLLALVVSLDLSGNRISGIIPDELGLLTGLFNLNLSNNLLTGPIPTSLGNVLTLESLDLSNNQLNGTLPIQLMNIRGLAFLNVSNNQLSGAIPTGGQFSTFSNASYLGNENLCGPPLTLKCSDVFSRNETHNSNKSKHTIIIVSVVLVSACIIFAMLAWYIITQRRKCKVAIFDTRVKLSARDISRSTMKFSHANIIGRGGSSVVYKGVLNNGMAIAVKKFKIRNHPELEKSFLSESTILGQIRHRNLVKILGTLTGRDLKCLILEYIPNGNLDMHLYSEQCDLSWEHRFKIALGVAHGLVYLHNETGFGCVLHCDLKPSNILLDKDYEPHISDFGIARMISSDMDTSVYASGMHGSIGYVAPEYAYGERLTDKVDVYSFGIVLLEMITRKRPTSANFVDDISLPKWVKAAVPANWIEIIDPSLKTEIGKECDIYSVLCLALSCVNDSARDRPPMIDVRDTLLRLKNLNPDDAKADMSALLQKSEPKGTPYVPNVDSEMSSSSNLLSLHTESSTDLFQSH